jgi:membrane protease subunit HflK
VAWNEPGSGGKDPWGQRRPDQGPPDLDQIFRNISNKLRGIFGGGRGGGSSSGGGSSGTLPGIGLIVGVAVAIWLITGFYIVQQSERAVVLRFGSFSSVTEAGLHWRWPYPIERVEKVDVGQVFSIKIGYLQNERTGAVTKVPKEALMLTEDENIVDLEFAVQYRISDASLYLFKVRDPEATIRQATESAVREVVGKNKLDFVLTDGRDVIAQQTQALLQDILDRYESGIRIVTVQMQDARAPEEVTAAFEDAIKAREDAERKKNEAEAYSNDIIPRARGAAARMVQEAQAYRASVIARAEGDARRFTQIVGEYNKAPGVTRDRLYIDAMEFILSRTTKVFIDQRAGGNMIYLPLDRLLSQGTGAAPVTTGPVTNLIPPAEVPVTDAGSRDRGRERGAR